MKVQDIDVIVAAAAVGWLASCKGPVVCHSGQIVSFKEKAPSLQLRNTLVEVEGDMAKGGDVGELFGLV